MKSEIHLSKPPRIVSWKSPTTPVKRKQKASAAVDEGLPSIREVLDGGDTHFYVVEPLAPAPSPNTPGLRGTAILVPNGQDYYFVLVYIGGEENSMMVSLPAVQGIVVMDLPDGIFTSPDIINQVIQDGLGGGPPSIVGPS